MNARNFRITVEGTSLCAYCEYEEHAVHEAQRMARATGRAVLVVQLLPEYRVVAEIDLIAAQVLGEQSY